MIWIETVSTNFFYDALNPGGSLLTSLWYFISRHSKPLKQMAPHAAYFRETASAKEWDLVLTYHIHVFSKLLVSILTL